MKKKVFKILFYFCYGNKRLKIYDILVVEDIVVVWIMIMILYGKVVRDLVVLLFYGVYMYMGFVFLLVINIVMIELKFVYF